MTALILAVSLALAIAVCVVVTWRRRTSRGRDATEALPPVDWDRFMHDLDRWQRGRDRPTRRNG
jgi:hypothetical protein